MKKLKFLIYAKIYRYDFWVIITPKNGYFVSVDQQKKWVRGYSALPTVIAFPDLFQFESYEAAKAFAFMINTNENYRPQERLQVANLSAYPLLTLIKQL